MTPAMSGKNARLIVMMTGFIAFTSIAVAGMLALRLSRTRDMLHARLHQCACCDDLKPGRSR